MGSALRFGHDELSHYYYAQAVFNHSGRNKERFASSELVVVWSDYRTALFDHLQNSQNKDGSWPAGDGLGVGPVYATAVWCTVLQLDRDRHPSMQGGELLVK